MPKKNKTIIWVVGILVILMAAGCWTILQMQSTGQGTAASNIYSQNGFFRFLENFFGNQGPNTSSNLSNGSNLLDQNNPGMSATGQAQNKTANNVSLGALSNGATLNVKTSQGTGSSAGQTYNSEANAIDNSVIDKEISLENNPGTNADNNTEINSPVNAENNPQANADNTAQINAADNSGDNSGDNTSDNSADNSSDNSGDMSGGNSDNNSGGSGANSCVEGCYPGCIPGCDSECTPGCLSGAGAGNNSGGGSGNNSGNTTQLNLPVINPIPSDAQVAQSIAQQNQQANMLASLVANQNTMIAQVRQSAEASKYQTVSSSNITPADPTPAPQDIVDKIKSAQLIQH